jgi:pyridinium-3,5-bisthiocarboxylic acid mononucleotide nickel chelatase
MKIGTIECFAGISGDMLLGALIDAGVPAEMLQNAAEALQIGAELRIHSVNRSGIQATKVDVLENGALAERHEDHAYGDEHGGEPHGHHDHHHGNISHHHHGTAGHSHGSGGASASDYAHTHGRNWPQIRELITAAAIPEGAKAIALRAFALLAEAEAKVHGIAAEEVHFHEVGAVDTITDIVCAAVGLDSLGVTAWCSSAVNVGSGFVMCAHGEMPVPAPATAELLRDVPVYSAGPRMELTTPTGAAMLRALACTFEPQTPLTVSAVGYGAGGRNPNGFANVLRLSVGTAVEDAGLRGSFSRDRVVVLECALDDATPQLVAQAMELALEHGALDVMAAPVTMKKGRLGTLLTVLTKPENEVDLQNLLFRETTTLGIRRREEERVILDREFVTVDTQYGKVRMKVASAGGQVLNAMPEYEDCRRAAREYDVALRAVMEAATSAHSESRNVKEQA